MKVEHLEFPNDLKRKLTARISNSIKAQFYDGANITTDRFNIALVEPFKIVFTKRNNNVVIFVVSKKNDDRTAYEFFIDGWIVNSFLDNFYKDNCNRYCTGL